MINLINSENSAKLAHFTYQLMQRMHNPICGLTQEIGFIKKPKFGANIYTAGADILGVHNLLNQKDPGRGAYHTGGSGIFFNEPIIKSLGETVERYAQLIAEYTERHEFIFASYADMHKNYKNVLDESCLDLYSEYQFARSNFPFNVFDKSLPLLIHEDETEAIRLSDYYLAEYLRVWADATDSWNNCESSNYPGYTGMSYAIRQNNPLKMRETMQAIVGTPKAVARYINELAEITKVNQILWQVDFGGKPFEVAMNTLQLFMKDVVPLLKNENLYANEI